MFLKKFYNLLILIFLSLFLTACAVNNSQITENGKKIYEKEPITPVLINEINQIALSIKENNLALLNGKYVHPINGYYNITKLENRNIFEIKNSFTEVDNSIDSFEIRFDKVTFNCSPYDDSFYGWDKYGIFINAQTKPHISKIMEEVNIIQPNSYKPEDIEKVDFMEQTSYEVTIPYVIIFYISKIDNQWYITLVDEITTDCSR
jgi:hypothetical protein